MFRRCPRISKSRLFVFYMFAVCVLLYVFSCFFVQLVWPLGPSDEYLADHAGSVVAEIRCAAEFMQKFSL